MSTNTSIVFHQLQGVDIGFNRQDGYLNATKLCTAYNLQFSATKRTENWLTTQRTKDYIAYVKSVTENTVTPLVVVKKGGNSSEQGTWIHPDLGNAFASWLSVEYEYLVSKWIQAWRAGIATSASTTSNQTYVLKEKEQLDILCFAIESVYSQVQLKPELVAGLKLNMVQQMLPEHAALLEPIRQPLINATAQEHLLLTATEIGKRLNLSAQAVNKKLIEAGLQVKNESKRSKKDCSYVPTGRGSEFSDLTLACGTGKDNTTYQQLRWYESVISLFLVG